ncbi:MAG TPA: orotidine-5'-phosphate decarboxylase [Polyangiaceae bacterium]|nr:orotidine-5'-phosphate decarboxylase [Polyangiaceae bacterium]
MSLAGDPRERLAFPLDFPDLAAARRGAERVAGAVGVLKVGLELFVRSGPAAVALGTELGCSVFLDLKLHDIPATVDGAVASAASLGARYLTIHASGGPRMVEAACRRAAAEAPDLVILAVTVLTSMDDSDLRSLGIAGSVSDHALGLARAAYGAGARGFVCSPSEVRRMRQSLGADVVLVTPGIRPAGAASGDQKRTGTPREAILDGADLLVVGRPIRDASDPAAAARAIVAEIAEALGTAQR